MDENFWEIDQLLSFKSVYPEKVLNLSVPEGISSSIRDLNFLIVYFFSTKVPLKLLIIKIYFSNNKVLF